MKKIFFLSVIPLFLFLVSRCHRPDQSRLLSTIDSMIYSLPDSALLQLEHVQFFDQMSESDQMQYIWLQAYLHNVLGLSLSEDSLIPRAVEYYKQKGDSSKLVMGYRLKSAYLKWQHREDEALAVIDSGLKEARLRADSLSIISLLYFKSYLYYIHYRDYQKSLCESRKCLDYLSVLSPRNQHALIYFHAINLSLVGNDSSEYFYEKSFDIAMSVGDSMNAFHYMRNQADNLSYNGDVEQSNKLIRKLWQLAPLTNDMLASQMIFVLNCLNRHQLDSAKLYLDIVKKTMQTHEKESRVGITSRCLYYVLNDILNYGTGRYVQAYDIGRFCDSIMYDYYERELDLKQKMESRMRMERQNYTLSIEKQQTRLALICTIFVLIICGIATYLYIRHHRQLLADAEERLETLNRLLTDANSNEDSADEGLFLKKILLQQLGLIRLVATAPTIQNQELLRRMSGISNKELPVESLLVWNDLYPVIDKLFNGFYSRLNSQYGKLLTDKEMQICCLLCANFSTKEIGVVTQQTVATIYVRKTSIRKKCGMDEKADIVSYINGVKTSDTQI